ncbi:MAG: energy-coupling factor ABC transporter ATP-binding protein [Candidatus Thorarchaeota archaeon]|nr:MAG: ABC transporter ATP-binding protein [Candidatus Thorarchaeota archaeon]RLI59976.1 MAG: ABC transporter ATP-binding protein [Candidatus Thorarchaeota archaeon]
MIIIEDVHFSYDGLYTALRGVSLQIDDGESLAIMGTNGAGKTTLVKHFNGLLRPQSGRVILNGADTKDFSIAEIAREVGLVMQNPDHQLFLDTVEKEIVFGLKNLGFTEEEATERCSRTITSLGLEGLAQRSPFALSGGERKRVALASVLATEPRVVVLDEPTIGQDACQKQRLAEMLESLNERGRTVVVVTHDIEFVIEHLPRTVAMANGTIVADGQTNKVLSNDEILECCSLTPPQLTQAARSLHEEFPTFPERLTLLSEVESEVLRILGGENSVIP